MFSLPGTGSRSCQVFVCFPKLSCVPALSLKNSLSVSLRRANLSDSYFTNRQDRYVLLENCGEVADFFSDLVEAVGDVSLQLQPDDSVTVLEGMVHPYKGRNRTRVRVRAHTRQRVLTQFDTPRSAAAAPAPSSARGADGFR